MPSKTDKKPYVTHMNFSSYVLETKVKSEAKNKIKKRTVHKKMVPVLKKTTVRTCNCGKGFL